MEQLGSSAAVTTSTSEPFTKLMRAGDGVPLTEVKTHAKNVYETLNCPFDPAFDSTNSSLELAAHPRACGFKIMYSNVNLANFISWTSRSRIRVVHLMRGSRIRAALSILRAKSSGQFHRHSESALDPAQVVPLNLSALGRRGADAKIMEVVHSVRRDIDDQVKVRHELLKRVHYVREYYYEDLVNAGREGFGQLIQFILGGRKGATSEADLLPISTEKLFEIHQRNKLSNHNHSDDGKSSPSPRQKAKAPLQRFPPIPCSQLVLEYQRIVDTLLQQRLELASLEHRLLLDFSIKDCCRNLVTAQT